MSSSVRLGWLAIPAFLVVLTLVGFGVSTEPAEQFEQRAEASDSRDADVSELDGPPEGRPVERGEPTPSRSTEGDPVQGSSQGAVEGEGAEVTIIGEDGEIVIRTDADGRPIRLTPVDGEAIDVDPDDLAGIRLTEDGRLEVVPLDEIGPDDTVVVPADGGFDLLRPDGSRVEFRADGENDGITATEISPDGEATELVPNPDGSVTLSDGTTVGPIDLAEDGGTIERFIDRTRDLPWLWVFLGLALLAGASIALALYLHRNRPRDDFDLGQLARADIPDDRFEQFLAALEADADPSRAIRIGFSVAERGLGGVPARRADETPFEWHRRIEDHQPALDSPGGATVGQTIGTVCDLFARVRFAPGQASDLDRRAMIDALRTLHRRTGQGAGPTQQPVQV